MASIREVTHWLTFRGVTHVVAAQQGGWSYTLCGSMLSYDASTIPPWKMRLCRKCRAMLATATIANQEPNQSIKGTFT